MIAIRRGISLSGVLPDPTSEEPQPLDPWPASWAGATPLTAFLNTGILKDGLVMVRINQIQPDVISQRIEIAPGAIIDLVDIAVRARCLSVNFTVRRSRIAVYRDPQATTIIQCAVVALTARLGLGALEGWV